MIKMAKARLATYRRSAGGFTFVELLLVIFVLITAGAGLIGSYFSTHYLSHYAKEVMMATDDLRDMMERINATPFNALAVNFPDGVANGTGNSYPGIVGVGAYLLPSESITVTYPPPVSATKREVLVTVTWKSRGASRWSSLAGLRTSS